MVFSFMQAKTNGDSNQLHGPGGAFETNEATDNNISGETRDFDLKAVWSYGPLDYFAGYMMSSWNGMPTDPVPGGEGGFFGSGPVRQRGRDNISFNSWHGGVRWRFGQKK